MNESLIPWIDSIVCGDALSVLAQIPGESIDLVLTDPPYFLDKLDNNWNTERAARRNYKSQTVFHLPPGMKFDSAQSIRVYSWYLDISREIYRILKPGGFFFTFASPRLYHRVACAVEDANLFIRDTFLWLYLQSQPKAMSLYHFLKKLPLEESKKAVLENKIRGWKTPQIKSCFEPIVVAQKPYEGTLLENFIKHEVSLFNTQVKVGQNMFPANILIVDETETILDKYFLIPKPSRDERGSYNIHPTIKPVSLCEHLIKLSTVEGAVVLDPFMGSGTTAIAALKTNRHFIGIEINQEYVEIAQKRIDDLKSSAVKQQQSE